MRSQANIKFFSSCFNSFEHTEHLSYTVHSPLVICNKQFNLYYVSMKVLV